MAQGKFDEFTDLSHLFSASTNIVVADVSKVRLFIFALDWVALWRSVTKLVSVSAQSVLKRRTSVDHSVLCYYTELGWICLHHFELNGSHATAHEEGIALSDGSVG